MADIPLTDDYVGSLLAKEAKESSIKYSALGIEAFLPSKLPTNKPKPNTRFLRNIIKETDNHNAALLAKEAAESRARLQNLEDKKRPGPADIRRRQLGHITAHLTSARPSKGQRDEKSEQRSRRRITSSEDGEPKQGEKQTYRRNKTSSHDREHDHDHRDDDRDSSRRNAHRSRSTERHTKRHRRRSRSRSRSPRERRSTDSRHRHRSPNRSSRLKRDADEVPVSRRQQFRRSASPDECSSLSSKPKPNSKSSHRSAGKLSLPTTADSDSDPLDAIIGPRPDHTPKVSSRGRGLTSTASGIDSRFSGNYDPQSDVALEDEENDWEQALEALRDRQKWKAQGAARLRAAGFTDEQVAKWEKGGEKSEADVKWAKKGEGREWDRGKVVGADGIFGSAVDDLASGKEVEASWGRLKGT